MKDFIPIKTVYYDDLCNRQDIIIYIDPKYICEIYKYEYNLLKFKLLNGSEYMVKSNDIEEWINNLQKQINENNSEEQILDYIEKF